MTLSSLKPETVIVDLGYRCPALEETEVLHRGNPKQLAQCQCQWVKLRQAIDWVMGHVKEDCRMRRCWLKGAEGDAVHTAT